MPYRKFKQIVILFIFVIFISIFIACGIFLSQVQPVISNMDIYAKPNVDSLVLSHANKDSPLVAIFRDDKWVKVGDISNGMSGWMLSSDFRYIHTKFSISNGKISKQNNQSEVKKIKLSSRYTQTLSLEQKLNIELSQQPDSETVDALQKKYLSQMLLMKKMIKNMQPQSSEFQTSEP